MVLAIPAILWSLFVGWGSGVGYPSNTPVTFRGVGVRCWLSQQYSGHFSWGGGQGAGYPSKTLVTFRGVGVRVLAIPAKLPPLRVQVSLSVSVPASVLGIVWSLS